MTSSSTRLQGLDGPIGTTIRMSAKDYERREKKQLDTKDLSEDEIESLKNTDLFMFYSIPEVRRAAMYLEDIAPQNNPRNGQQGRSSKRPKKGPVVRRTCLSTEAHPSTMLMDLLGDDLDIDTSTEMI